MDKKTYYPIFGIRSKIHATEMTERKTMLCGSMPGRFWEVVYGSQVFPEIERVSIDIHLKLDEYRNGLFIAGEHVPKAHFCPKCYEKIIAILA